MRRPLPERYRRWAPVLLRALPILAVAVTLLLVAGRHDRRAANEAVLRERLDAGGLVVLLADACSNDRHAAVAQVVASPACPGAASTMPYLADFSGDRALAAERTRALRALVASWRGPGNLLVATHRANIAALTERVAAPGEAVVVQPETTGGEVLGQLRADDPPPH